MNKILIIIGCGVALFIGGCFTGYFLGLPEKPVDNEILVNTTQLSGDKIEHSDFEVTRNDIIFRTVSSGQGEIQTVIKKEIVPEAKYWIDKVNIVQVSFDHRYNLSGAYLRRFGVFAVGGGVSIPLKDDNFKIFVTGQYMF